jgi:general secretion pathway protein E
MGVERFLLAPMLRGLVAQRLVRRICPDCATPHALTDTESGLLNGLLPAGAPVSRGTGCSQCHGSGYRGRLPIYEIIEIDGALERLVHEGASEAQLTAAARKRGPGLLQDGVEKLRDGLTTVEEVARAVREDTTLPEIA